MKRMGFLAVAVAVAVAALGGCLMFPSVIGSGRIVEKTFPGSGFTRVQGDQTFHVTLRYAPKTSVSVSVDDNLVDHLEVSLAGDTLRLSLAPGYWYRNCTVRAVVELPLLQEIACSGASTGLVEKGFPPQKSFAAVVSGASVLDVSGLDADAVIWAVSGASTLTAGVAAASVSVDCSGASKATLAGSAKVLRADCSGAGRIAALDCPAGGATVNADGASTVSASITAGGSLSYALSGASTLYYKGASVALTQRESSGASILRRLD